MMQSDELGSNWGGFKTKVCFSNISDAPPTLILEGGKGTVGIFLKYFEAYEHLQMLRCPMLTKNMDKS